MFIRGLVIFVDQVESMISGGMGAEGVGGFHTPRCLGQGQDSPPVGYLDRVNGRAAPGGQAGGDLGQRRSKRSAFITLTQAAMKAWTKAALLVDWP